MVKAVLLIVGISVVLAQPPPGCYQQNVNNCTGVSVSGQTCRLGSASCTRNTLAVAACNTSSTTCTGPACAAGNDAVDGQSCSKCTDQCSAATSETQCTGAAMQGACNWSPPLCYGSSSASYPCSGTTKASCTGEAGCYWFSVSKNVCNQSATLSACLPCNATYVIDQATRSALYNNIGKTCSWAAAGGYQPSSLMINDMAQSSDTVNCPAFAAASGSDAASITAAAASGRLAFPFVASNTAASCSVVTGAPTAGQSSSAPSPASSSAPSSGTMNNNTTKAPTGGTMNNNTTTNGVSALIPGFAVVGLIVLVA